MHYQRKIDFLLLRLEALRKTGETFDRQMLYAFLLLVVNAIMMSPLLVTVAFTLCLICALLRFCVYLAKRECRRQLVRYLYPNILTDWTPDD
jgi:hypothetical protein